MEDKWIKYTLACDPDECDSLIELTAKVSQHLAIVSGFRCFCGRVPNVLSVADATINNNNEQKEDSPMNTTTTFLETRVAELEAQLKSHQNCDYWKSENGRIQRQLIDTINDAYEGDKDASEILTEIRDIIDYHPTKTVEFTARIQVSGSVDVPIDELADFDIEQTLEDMYVDINNGNVIIDNQELYDVDTTSF